MVLESNASYCRIISEQPMWSFCWCTDMSLCLCNYQLILELVVNDCISDIQAVLPVMKDHSRLLSAAPKCL